MHLCSLNSKSEPEARLVEEISREFANERPDVIQWAFREHRRQCKFFPSIFEISELVACRRRQLREAAQIERDREERAETEKARADGKLVDVAEIRRVLLEFVKRFPDTSPGMVRHQASQEAEKRLETPPIALRVTPEQIAERRHAERAEIAKYADEDQE